MSVLVVRVRCPRCRRWVRFLAGALEAHETTRAGAAVTCAVTRRAA